MEENNLLIRQNVNFLEFPIWSINKDDSRDVFDIKTKQGIFTYRANKSVGIPDATDMNFLYYLLLLAQKNNSNTIYTTIYEVCKNTNYTTNKRIYDRVKKSLDKWSSVSILFEGNYYCPKDQKKYSSMGFHVLKFKINKDSVKKGSAKILKVEFDEDFLESSKQIGLFNLVDFKLYVALKTPLSKRIYEYLPKHLNGDSVFKISDTLLFPKLRLVRKVYKSDVIRQFESIQKAIDKFNSAQIDYFIVFWYDQKQGSTIEFICKFKNDIKRVKKKIQIQKSEKQELNINPVVQIIPQTPNFNVPKYQEIRKKLEEYGFRGIAKIFKQHSLEVLESVLIDFEVILNERQKNNPIPSKGGYIRSMLPEVGQDYEFSSIYKKHLTELERKENKKQKDKKEIQDKIEEKIEQKKEEVLTKKIDVFFLDLSQEEQDIITQEAKNQTNSFFQTELGIKIYIRQAIKERYKDELKEMYLKQENVAILNERLENQNQSTQQKKQVKIQPKTQTKLSKEQLESLVNEAIEKAEIEVSQILSRNHNGFKVTVKSRVHTLIKEICKEKHKIEINKSDYESLLM